MVQVSVFNEGMLDNDFASISNCGFSPMAIICAIIVALVMMLFTWGLGLRKFKKGSPLWWGIAVRLLEWFAILHFGLNASLLGN